MGVSLLAARNTFSHRALSLAKISFSFCSSCWYSSAASSALDGFCAMSSAICASPLVASFASPLGAEHAARVSASTGSINRAAIFDSFMVPPFISKLI